MGNIMNTLVAALTAISLVIGGFLLMDNRHVSAANYTKLQHRVLTNELNQSYRDARSEVYDLRKILRKHPGNQLLKQKLTEAEEELNRLKKELKR